MHVFSSRIEVPAGPTLAGFGDRLTRPTTEPGVLELHGVGSKGDSSSWELCSIDALYAGALASPPSHDGVRRVFAASHTHFAPMLDPRKPRVGIYSPETLSAFEQALSIAPREPVEVDTCSVYRGQIGLPVYRRFDFPPSAVNGVLTRRAGFYPNEAHPVDRSIYVFVFSRGERNEFAFVHHANHPVTRHSGARVSADYVQALRDGVRARFGVRHCLFLLGCSGDIRPNVATKRVQWLPRSRLNWKFRYALTAADQDNIDHQYESAVEHAERIESFPLSGSDFQLESHRIEVHGLGLLNVPRLRVGSRLTFAFLPFEVSHRYHLEAVDIGNAPRRLIVSCADDTRGYLPHAEQLKAGGYEVDGSRAAMGVQQQVSLKSRDLW